MERERPQDPTPSREDVDPADALGGAGALPLPDGQARGVVPSERDAPGTATAPEEIPNDDEPGEG